MTLIEFNTNVTRLQDQLLNFAYRYTSSDEDAKDLLQETILKALRHRNKFQDKTNLRAWMFTIMKNTFINNYRRKKNSQTFLDNTQDLYYLNNSASDTHASPESYVGLNQIHEHIADLEEDIRVPFEMYVEGFKYKEIAEDLDIPIGTVKSRIFNARKQLMSVLERA